MTAKWMGLNIVVDDSLPPDAFMLVSRDSQGAVFDAAIPGCPTWRELQRRWINLSKPLTSGDPTDPQRGQRMPESYFKLQVPTE